MHRLLCRSISLLAYIPKEMWRHMAKPLSISFSTRAFLANLSTANAVANTRYLQSMHRGALSPLDYGCLTVQDAYYCYHAKDTLKVLLDRIDGRTESELYELVESKLRAYDDYNRTFIEDWHIRDAESVLPTETMRLYAAHERRVACEEEPIYGLVAYLPCYQLWPWFARQLMRSPLYRPGVYKDWFECIYQGERESFGGSWLMGNFIEDWRDRGKPFDEDLANDIYRTSMDFELKVFTEACPDA